MNNLNDLNNLNYDGNKKYIGVGTGMKGVLFARLYKTIKDFFFGLVKSTPPPFHFAPDATV